MRNITRIVIALVLFLLVVGAFIFMQRNDATDHVGADQDSSFSKGSPNGYVEYQGQKVERTWTAREVYIRQVEGALAEVRDMTDEEWVQERRGTDFGKEPPSRVEYIRTMEDSLTRAKTMTDVQWDRLYASIKVYEQN